MTNYQLLIPNQTRMAECAGQGGSALVILRAWSLIGNWELGIRNSF